jgi:PAS domain S-box-containing protein
MKDQLIRLLIIEDSEDDALLIIHGLKKGGYNPVYERVETAAAMKKALKERQWDIILCDYKMPNFSAPSAIALLKEIKTDIPLIIVSGAIGEEAAVECMRLGARDYILKSNLIRLCPVIARELEYVKVRNKQKRIEDELASINKRIVEELRESEEKYRSLFENSIDAILLTVPDGRILAANPAAGRMFGHSEEEICRIGRTGLLDKTNPRLEAGLEERRRTGRFGGELTYVRKDGTKFVGEISTSIFKDRNGNPRTSMIIRDITKSKRAEEKFHNIFMAMPNCIGITRLKDGLLIDANKGYEDTLGWKREEVIGIKSIDWPHNFWVDPSARALMVADLKAGRDVLHREIEFRRGDGSLRVGNYSARPIYIDNEECLIFILQDITERKLAEEKFYKIFMTTPDCIVISRLKDGLLIDVNKGFEGMVGWKREEAIGTKSTEQPLNLWVDLSARELMAAQLKAGKDVLHHEFEFRKSDGSIHAGIYSARTINIDGEECLIFILQDISERKQAEEQLRKSEGIFRVLFNQSVHLIGLMKPDGTLLQINTTAKTFAAVREEDVLGKPFWAAPWWSHSPAEREQLKKAIKKAANGEFICYETTHFNCAGVMRHVEFSISPVKDDNGVVILLIPEGSDITERKQAEERLSKSEKKFSSTFHLTPNPMAISDMVTGKYIDVNNAFTRWTGYSREEVIGLSAQDLNLWVNPEQHKKIISALTVEGEINSVEVLIRQKNGNIRNVLFSVRFIEIEQERHLLTLYYDITDRKRAEEALRNSHRRLDEIIDFLPDATFVIDREGKIITWNKSTEMITGVSKADMIGKGNYEYAIPFYGEHRPVLIDLALLPDNVFENSHYENVYRQGDTLFAEAYLPMVYGGKGAFMWGTASKLRDASGNIIGAIESVRDITGRKKVENELKRFAENLEDANTALRVLMNHRDKDQKEFEEKLQVNINDLVIPYLKKLNREKMDNRNKNYVSVLENNLSDVLSPFMRDFRSSHKNLTPKEIQIVDLITKGKDTKEIADMLNASINTIATHRNNIRKKLSLRNSKINLRSHILSLK